MKFVVDTHTHTIASSHAYSTIIEMAEAAAESGLELLCITDHAPALPDSSDKLHFMNYHILPNELCGVSMLYGVELNIMDYDGNVDLEEDILKKQDICIASFHTMCTKAGNMDENTNAYLQAMENPYINIIGHPEDGNVPVDFEKIVKMAKQKKVMLEVNNSSQKSAFYRLNPRENIIKMLELCKQYGVYISLGSDAHFVNAVGDFTDVISILEEIDFPMDLIANTSVEKFKKLLKKEDL